MAALDGKICVITGATSGIGLATAEQLAAAGARLVLVGRDRARGEAAVQRLQALRPTGEVTLLLADLSHFAGMRRLAADLAALPRIDVLINNAGGIFNRRRVTEDGLELTFALNHMAYYVLTRLLIGRLAASAPARIVNVASRAHVGAQLDFADLQMERSFAGWRAYGRSRLCNILFTRELARRLTGSGITANCLHPGFVATRFGNNAGGAMRAGLALAKRLFALSPAEGAKTMVYLASSAEVAARSGGYYERCALAEPSREACSDGDARRLWELSAEIAGTGG